MAVIITGGVIQDGDKFLLVQENKPSCRGLWSIPAGHLEKDEVLTEGAIREVREECGLEVELTGIAKIGSIPIRGSCMVNIMFTTRVTGGKLAVDGYEITDARWFTYDEIASMREALRAPGWTLEILDNVVNGRASGLELLGVK